MIVRISVMSTFGVELNFKMREIKWEGMTTPMKDQERFFEDSQLLTLMQEEFLTAKQHQMLHHE